MKHFFDLRDLFYLSKFQFQILEDVIISSLKEVDEHIFQCSELLNLKFRKWFIFFEPYLWKDVTGKVSVFTTFTIHAYQAVKVHGGKIKSSKLIIYFIVYIIWIILNLYWEVRNSETFVYSTKSYTYPNCLIE